MINHNESTHFKRNLSIEINGFLMDFSTTKIMGIINITPDSFYDGGALNSMKKIIDQAEQMLLEGADILDIGAFSSRPGANLVSEKEELDRLIPALKELTKEFPNSVISVDTFRSNIAKQAIDIGAHIINDISGGNLDSNMFSFIAQEKIPYILMHMQNQPNNMQANPVYHNVVTDLYAFFHEKVSQLNALGATDIIIDPGFGFGKNLQHNYQLLKQLRYFENLGCPILAGMSRKKMIQKIIDSNVEQALNGTSVVNTIALLNGANILRVHDVKAAKEAAKIVDYMQKQ